jgi:cell wall-associated NlpC family hydrolase
MRTDEGSRSGSWTREGHRAEALTEVEFKMRRIYAVAISLAMLVATPGLATADQSHKQAIDYVIARALSQRGVPYTYGGGNTQGPTASTVPAPSTVAEANVIPAFGAVPGTTFGPNVQTPQLGPAQLGPAPAAASIPGAEPAPTPGVVGFDASGLIQYAFAGVGIKMPRSSGEQYKVGRKVLPSQALPGDLIFFGPDGTQSVALFLGNGQMLEATDPAVTVSPVRTNGMAPYLSRMIDWQ